MVYNKLAYFIWDLGISFVSNKRVKDYFNKIHNLISYIDSYQTAVRALRKSYPKCETLPHIDDFLPVGSIKIFQCSEGIIALFYKNLNEDAPIKHIDEHAHSINKVLEYPEIAEIYDEYGQPIGKMILRINDDPSGSHIHSSNQTMSVNGRVYASHFNKLTVIGCNVKIPNPVDYAINDFKKFFMLTNTEQSDIFVVTPTERTTELHNNYLQVLSSFEEILKSSLKEEELQVFFQDQPRFIFPDFIEVYPKFKLGEDYVTDFVFLIQGLNGPEYYFVEIERHNKEIFTKEGQLSAQYTQAKHQLNTWDTWITHNISYVKNKLPNLYKPRFLLIMGRSINLSEANRNTITNDLKGTNIEFCTYDDLTLRFKRICNAILGTS